MDYSTPTRRIPFDDEYHVSTTRVPTGYTRAQVPYEVLSFSWCLKLTWAAGGHFSGSGPGSCNNGHHLYILDLSRHLFIRQIEPRFIFLFYSLCLPWDRRDRDREPAVVKHFRNTPGRLHIQAPKPAPPAGRYRYTCELQARP